jgi:serine/threonine-protein kinase
VRRLAGHAFSAKKSLAGRFFRAKIRRSEVCVSEVSSVLPIPKKEEDGDAPTVPRHEVSLAEFLSSPQASEGAEDQIRNPSFHPGARIADKYIVERLIGEGGLGVVVAAKHVHLDHSVAIKYLRPKALATKAVAERFLREARLAARIRSEHIVHVYDVGTLPDGAPYMVMEYLAGTDLGRMLSASGPLSVDRAVDYVLQACEALAEAHVAGIVHRDIKPDNLFIATSPGGTSVLKVLDFGISKMSAKRTTSGGVGELTEVGDKFGTPVYMSPEQLLASGNVDARTDVWAIGVVLYELLTGALPFDGDSLPELVTAILHRPPRSLLLARPYLPTRLQTIIEQCLTKDVESRFQNVAELAQELRPFAGAAGGERIEQVVRVILGAGDKVRMSTPSPATSSVDALREALTLTVPAERSVATTGSGVASWMPMSAFKKGAGHDRRRLFVVAGAGAVAAALAIAALTGARSSPATAAEHAAAVPAAASALPPQSATAAELPPAPLAEEHLAAPVDVPPSASAAVAAPAVRGGHRVPKPAGSGNERPSHSDPNAVINPFE